MWRLMFIVGAAFLGSYGCSRKKDEETNRNAALNPATSTSAGRFETPVVPPDFSSRFSRPPSALPSVSPISPRVDCSRFQQPYFRSSTPIIHPQDELAQLGVVMAQIRSHHTSEIQQGNFEGVRNDAVISGALNLLEGTNVYLRDGQLGTIDTEADIENLDATRLWLLDISRIPTTDTPNNLRVRALWNQNKLGVFLGGYLFNPDEAPHNFVNQTTGSAPARSPQQFRIVVKTNIDAYSVLNSPCGSIPLERSSSLRPLN